jgi:uncharacterized membrane protein YebE (DUF533 family)
MAYQDQTILDNLKKKSAEASEKVASAVFCVGGGAFAAFLEVERPGEEHIGVSEGTLLGALATTAGLLGWVGAYSQIAESFGSGMLAVEVYKVAKQKLQERKNQQPQPGSRGVGASADVRRITDGRRAVSAADLERYWANVRRAA